jgi:hypothetical protein
MWFSQLLAPPLGALRVGNAGQRTHNDTALDLLQNKWKGKGVEIERAPFQFDGANPPLSWHLTKGQKSKIEKQWSNERNNPGDTRAGWDRVHAFLSSEDNGSTQSGE